MTFTKLKKTDMIHSNTVWLRFCDGKVSNTRMPSATNCDIRLVNPEWIGHKVKQHWVTGNTWQLYQIRI